MKTATEQFAIATLGRCEIDGVEYVVYDDGAYRHAVYATDFDREFEDDKFSDPCDGYTAWCGTVDGPTDDIARRVAAELSLTHVHSLDGTCSRIDVDEEE